MTTASEIRKSRAAATRRWMLAPALVLFGGVALLPIGELVAMTKDSNTAIKTLADLDGKKVTVQVGTKSVSYLQQNHPKVQLVEVEKNQEMFNLVEIGRADAAVTGKPAAAQYARTRPGMRVLAQQLTTEEYGMAVRKDTPDLTKAINGALTKLKTDGTYAALVKKWFSGSTAK